MSGARLVGIVNVTPDSFSDGGKAFMPKDAVAAIEEQRKAGAYAVDIGAESTRPGATSLSWPEEWSRLRPVFEVMPKDYGRQVKLSIDSRHPQTVQQALEYGMAWINDVSGFSDDMMVRVASQSQCKVIVMHSLTVPADPSVVFPPKTDVVKEVLAFGKLRIRNLVDAGIGKDRIIFDPGVGFGKTADQSVRLLRSITDFRELGVELLVGHSRKSFLSAWGSKAGDRDAATLEVSRFLAISGVDYLRVHDVAGHAALLKSLRLA